MYYIFGVLLIGYFFARILFRILQCIHKGKLTPDKSGEPEINDTAEAKHARKTTMQAEIVTAKDTKSAEGDKPKQYVSSSALMARECGIKQPNFKFPPKAPQTLTESVTNSCGLVIVIPSLDNSSLGKLAKLEDDTVISFDDLKICLVQHEKDKLSEWNSIPREIKKIELYREFVGFKNDVPDLLRIFKDKMKKGGHKVTKKGLLEGIRLRSDKRADPEDDPDYAERLTAKLAQCVPLFQPKKVKKVKKVQ